MREVHQTLDATASAVASKVTNGGAAMTLLSWITASDIGVYVGIFIGIAGLLVNLYFKRRQDRRLETAHKAFMSKLDQANGTPLMMAEMGADE